ncbi:NUDIX domain-containing protein [Nannocystaceae bacterium ST9]
MVYVIIRFSTMAGPSVLLRHHEKWGDWSLVGGHVEPWEMDEWGLAATREANEELEPLVAGKDFLVTPIHNEPITWGPEPSRSAQGMRTVYHIRYYALAFLSDPIPLLGQLPTSEFLLVPEREIHSSQYSIGKPVHRARRVLSGGLEAVHPAWNEDIDLRSLPSFGISDNC